MYNLVKHAGASRGGVELHHEGNTLRIVVSDNGRGLVADRVGSSEDGQGGYGLYSVRERLALWGGSLSVDSDESGTRATIVVPREPTAPAEPGSAGRDVERATAIPREGSA